MFIGRSLYYHFTRNLGPQHFNYRLLPGVLGLDSDDRRDGNLLKETETTYDIIFNRHLNPKP